MGGLGQLEGHLRLVAVKSKQEQPAPLCVCPATFGLAGAGAE